VTLRAGIISDIHGNLFALDLVISALKDQNADVIVCLGDAAATGPRPHEVLERLRRMKIPTVKGNRDEYLLNIPANPPHKVAGDEYSNRVMEIDSWCRTRLTEEDIEFIGAFSNTLSIPVGSNPGEYLFCFHGSPKSNTDLITSITPEDDLKIKLAGHGNRIMLCGHTHVQMLRKYGETAIINPGSVGQAIEYSRSSKRASRVPWADYALVECSDEGNLQRVALSRVYLHESEVLHEAIASGMPHAEWWAMRK
jgi:predicted phosphodiesterase